MTYVVVTLVVLFFLNIYCSGVSHKLFYQSKEASMIEKCLLASDEISTLEVLNSSTVTGIVNQLESLKVTRLVVTDHSGAALYDSSGASVGTYVLLPEILQALTVSKQAPEGNNVFTWTYHDGITDSRAATPIVYYGTVVGCVYMTEYDTTQGTLIKSLQQTLLRITLMLEIIVAAFSVAFSNAFSRRLNRIMASMRIIREGDYSHKVDMGGSDELTVLGEEFNDLTERLQTSERKRSQFVSDASHELKTPMTTISGYVDGILDGTIPEDKREHYLHIVSDETKRLSRLVRSMLDISQLQKEGGIPEEKKMHFDLEECAGQVLITFEKKINDKHLNVNVDMPEHPVYTMANPDYITQVIYNLIDNAVKFCPDGGNLGLRIKEGGSKAYVSVSNDGETIPPDELPLVFDRFHKLDKSRSQNRDGWGLGLYIVKTIVCSHGEDISVSSKDGKTEFTFTMPLVN